MLGTSLGDEPGHHLGCHSNLVGIEVMIPIVEMCREHSYDTTQQRLCLTKKENEKKEGGF